MISDQPHARPITGVSACLLGNRVRFDGGHKNNRYISITLQEQMDLFPVCPETEMGVGIPRSPIQLRLVGRYCSTWPATPINEPALL